MTIPFKCVCRTIGLRASLGRFNDSLATVSIKDEAVVDELRLRQTLCILHHMQKIRADRCCRINAPVGRLGPCSNASQNLARHNRGAGHVFYWSAMVIQNGLFVLVWSGRRRRPARRPYHRTAQSSRCMTTSAETIFDRGAMNHPSQRRAVYFARS